ncbi:MAG: DUF4097 family beta strand repeat-containing protein [Candidatus Tumulicola sp.]
MMGAKAAGYNGVVFGRWWRGAAGLFLALSCWMVLAAGANADEQIGVGPTPWLDVQLGTGTLTVKTWDRPQVQVVTDGRVDVRHIDAAVADPRIPRQYTAWSQTVATDHGDVTMPEESFLLPQLQGSSHDEVVARGQGNTTIVVPRGTALVTAHVGTGALRLQNYHGVFMAHVRDGGVSMNHVDGSGYIESLRGPVTATNSSFNRLRVRTATGNMLFRDCTSRQIEASSNYGSIVYDNGTFQPGLAHFESVHGNVALGVRGGAQIGAHSGSGHIMSSFRNGAQMRGGHNTTQATVHGGGPMVTAVSKNGSVYLYNGSVRSHPRVQAEMQGAQVPARGYPVPARGYQVPARNYAAPRYPTPGYPAPQYYAPPRRTGAPPAQPQQRAPQQARAQPQPRQGPPDNRDGKRDRRPPQS